MPSADIHRQNLLTVFCAALERVNGRSCVREYLSAHPHNDPVYLIAIGKAATAMTRGAQDVLDGKIRDALVITKHGYVGAAVAVFDRGPSGAGCREPRRRR